MALPWDNLSILALLSQLVEISLDAFVCARAVASGISQGVGINAIVRILTVSKKCVAGRRQSGSETSVPRPRIGNVTQRLKLGAAKRSKLPRRQTPRINPKIRLRNRRVAARGHAAIRFLKIFAIGWDATIRCQRTLGLPCDIAVAIVARRCDVFATVNVSGCCVTAIR